MSVQLPSQINVTLGLLQDILYANRVNLMKALFALQGKNTTALNQILSQYQGNTTVYTIITDVLPNMTGPLTLKLSYISSLLPTTVRNAFTSLKITTVIIQDTGA